MRGDDFPSAAAALDAFGLASASASLRFVRHLTTVDFRVTGHAGISYLLRLHRPLSAFDPGGPQTREAVIAEMLWIEALGRDTDLVVQRPIRTRAGELATEVRGPAEEDIQCTLLEWIDGRPFPAEESEAAPVARELGRLLAVLHGHASAWQPPAAFRRPELNYRYLDLLETGVLSTLASELIEDQDRTILREALRLACSEVDAAPRSQDERFLIHNNLRTHNLLLCEGGLCPVDFSGCGTGNRVSDVATALESLPARLRWQVLDGYVEQSGRLAGTGRLLEAFLILSRMAAFCAALATGYEWPHQRAPQFVRTVCRPFLSGEPFLFGVR